MTTLQIGAAAAAVIGATLTSGPVAQSSTTVRPVAVAGQTQSDAGRIGEISSQSINNNGQVSFRAFYEDPTIPFGAAGVFVAGGNPPQAPQVVGGQGRPAPGTNAFFGGGGLGPLNNLGEVAFTTLLEGGDVDPFLLNNNALYVGTPQAQTLVAREGSQVPYANPGVVYVRSSSGGPFGRPLLNHAGQVAYVARLGGTGVNTTNSAALFVGQPDSVRIVSRAGDPSPVAGMNFVGAYTRPSVYPSLGPVLNDNGQVLFRDSLREAASGNLTTSEGLFFGSSRDNLSVVLKSGDAAPGAPAGTRIVSPATSLALNNAGQIAVGAALVTPGGANAAALYHGTPGSLRPVFTTGDAAPQTTSGVTFTDLYHGEALVMNAAGKTAFQAHLEGADAVGSFRDRALYTGTPDDLELVARLGDHAPGTPDDVVFRNIYGVAMNAPGQLAFHAMLGIANSDASVGYGIFGYDPAGGVSMIARTGDTFDLGNGQTGTIRAFAFNAESGGQDGRLISINDRGQVAFAMGFAEGGSGGAVTERQGLFLASIVPEPTASVIGLALAAGALLRRRRV